jgi:hypothetical protein
MKTIHYRIVTENFAFEPGQRWPIEVLIQTEDKADFADFEAATEEVLDRIQERIDRQEDRDEPDEGYLDKLREKLGDSNCGDWDEYCNNVSQPEVWLRTRGEHVGINLADIAGRKQMRRLINRGVEFKAGERWLLRRLERQATVGKRVVKVKRKRLKPRVRPALTFDCVRLDPRLSRDHGPEFIQGALEAHRRAYDLHDWNPYRDGFSSTIVQHGRLDWRICCLTEFFEAEDSVTFAALVPAGGSEPDDVTLMNIATEKYQWGQGTDRRRKSKRQTVLN